MFDPIKGPNNPYQGPAVGLGTENGDSWHTAVNKINAAFKNIVHAIETGPSIEGVEMVDAESRKEIAELREAVAAMQIKFDALTTPSAAPPASQSDAKPPETAPQAPIADFSAAGTVAAIPVTAGGPAT